MFDLSGKTIVLTAPYSPLGFAMADVLTEFHGHVCLCGRNEQKLAATAQKLLKAHGKTQNTYVVDVLDDCSVAALFAQIDSDFGGVDVLINNASSSVSKPIEALSGDEFNQGLNGSVGSVFRMTKQALCSMKKRRGGSIINIGSMYGHISPNPSDYAGTNMAVNPVSYGAGKASIIQFTKYVAANYGQYGIRANTVSPGAFPSENVTDETFLTNLKKKNPLLRLGVPADLKGIILLLSSDESAYITGQNIQIDGGVSIW